MLPFITLILEHPLTLVAGRLVLTSLFWLPGLFGLFKFSSAVQEMKDFQLPFPKAFAATTIGIQLVGSTFVLTNAADLGWLGAGLLAALTLVSIPIAHAFWKFEGARRTQETYIATEHVAVVGGLILVAILSLPQ